MKLLSRLFRTQADPREALRPLWHRVVGIAREKEWYADMGVADTLEGRFDMITAVLTLVLLRMEREEELIQPSVFLTELFVEDMDGQLRESGVGDLVVGKHIGRLVSSLGGRLGAYRAALAEEDDTALEQAVKRNLNLADESKARLTAAGLRTLYNRLVYTPGETLLAAGI